MLKNTLVALIAFAIYSSLYAQENKNIKRIIPQSKSTEAELKKDEQKYSSTQEEPKKEYILSSNDTGNSVKSDSTSKTESKPLENNNLVMTKQQYNDLIAALEGKLIHVKTNKSEYKKAKKSGWVKNTETEINRLKEERNSIFLNKTNCK